MRVAVHPAGDDACGLYRMVEPARVLADQGADVYCTRTVAWRFSRTDDDRPYRLVDTVDSDVVVFQRPLARRKYDMIRCLQEAGVAVVVELDDDFGNVHPRNAAWADAHPEWMTPAEAAERGVTTSERLTRGDHRWVRTPGVVSWSSNVWLRKACQVADLVTVTTPALAERYAPHGRVAVLPNLVPARYLDVTAAPHDGTVVGWGGSVNTHPDDLESAGGGIAQAVDDTGARFHVVGTGIGARNALGLTCEPTATGWVDLDGWPAALADLDVGVVPLAATRFNEAKSALKMLEYAATGVACVAAPTPDNVRLARLGVGMLAADPAHWRQWVALLASNDDARAYVAGRGREVAAAETYEAHADRWWDAWAKALDNRRATAREKAAA